MKPHRFVVFGLAGLVLSVAGAATAAPVTYSVIVNTSSISGTPGSLDFNFAPGAVDSQPAFVQISGFSSNGTLVSCPSNVQGFCNTGDVTGTLPGTLTFDNGTAFNDYFDDFTFGSTLSFMVSLSGPALSTPDGTSSSGSIFAFSMFSDPAGSIPALTSNNTLGYAMTVNVNLNGTTTVDDFSAQTTVPEPGSLSLMALGVGCCFAFWFRRHAVLG